MNVYFWKDTTDGKFHRYDLTTPSRPHEQTVDGQPTAAMGIPATVCFAAGAVAGGVSAGGHLADTTHLGTATTATVVLDVAQIVASFASAGAMSITVKAGGAAAALAGSRWFVPLVTTAATADGVQLVALTDITFTELSKIQNGAGTPEDKQRAMAVLLTAASQPP